MIYIIADVLIVALVFLQIFFGIVALYALYRLCRVVW